MNMGPGGKQIVSRDSGYYDQNRQWVAQSMADANGVPRGLRVVLSERGLWPAQGLNR